MRDSNVWVRHNYGSDSVRGAHKNKAAKAASRRAAKKMHRRYLNRVLSVMRADIAVVLGAV